MRRHSRRLPLACVQIDVDPRCRLAVETDCLGRLTVDCDGRAVGERAATLSVDMLAIDPFLDEDVADDPAALVDFEELLTRADLVTVKSLLTPKTRELFNADAFAQMRDDAYFANVTRRPIVATGTFVDALDAGELASAGLDVFPEEPPADDLLGEPSTC